MSAEVIEATAEAEIRKLVDGWVAAARAMDIEAIMAYYARDIVSFDAIAQLQFKGAEAYRAHWEACLAMCPGQMVFEVRDLGVVARGDIAFSHFLCRCGATGEKGEEQSSWMRATACYRRVGGEWRIVHEHFSAPFDPQSGKALFDLKP